MNFKERVFRKESLARYLDSDKKFSKQLGAFDLITMGIGIVIGTGIFILPGTVAAMHSGPAIILSFVVAAVVCSLAAMCYAEFSSALPVAGSAYSFGNVVFGEIVGWFLGWALILEYMLAVAATSTGFSAYMRSLLEGFGINLPKAISGPFDPSNGTYVNLIAILIVLFISLILSRGVRTSMTVNSIMVFVKVTIIIAFIAVGCFYVKPSNWHPFMPFGFGGVMAGAAQVFFAYLGFDAVAASAAEVKNPSRNMPRGIIGTLMICTVLYMLVSVVLTGMVSYKKLDVADPVAFALHAVNQNWFAGVLSVGALAGMFTMMVSMIFSSSRLIYSIGHSMAAVTIVIALMGGFVSLDQLTNLVNIGTLLAFAFVSLGIIPLRRRQDLQNDGFKVPFYPVLPILSAVLCVVMLLQLSADSKLAS